MSFIHLLALILILFFITAPSFSQSITTVSHHVKEYSLFSDDDTRGVSSECESWKFTAEANDAGKWEYFPVECYNFVKGYMTGKRYPSDSKAVAQNALDFAKSVKLMGDGKDAWVFDIDETLLSNIGKFFPPSELGSKSDGVNSDFLPAIPASLGLYNELKQLGFKVFLLTGRNETERNFTQKNLHYAGYFNWQRLIMRSHSEMNLSATIYKSQKRQELELDEKYRIHGSSGDQWSDLRGFSQAKRSFKLPNPMYYIE